jgi:hypothetical protein
MLRSPLHIYSMHRIYHKVHARKLRNEGLMDSWDYDELRKEYVMQRIKVTHGYDLLQTCCSKLEETPFPISPRYLQYRLSYREVIIIEILLAALK